MQLENIKSVLSFLGDSILILNENSEILYCNRAFCDLFGYTPDQVLNKNMSILVGQKYSVHNRSGFSDNKNADKSLKEMLENNTLLCEDSQGRKFQTEISISSLQTDHETLEIALVHDISSHEKAMREKEILIRTDFLTTLHNKRYLDELTGPESSLLTQYTSIGVLYLDLDKFKPVNDQYGHNTGDEVLKVISLRMKNSIRCSDMAFRVGGDEFVIFVFNVQNDKDLFALARKVGDSIENLIHVAGKTIHVKASIGACLYPYHINDIQKAVNLADTMMYRAKGQGKTIATVH